MKRIALAAAVMMLASIGASAQVADVADNQLRTGLLDLNKKISASENTLAELERSINKLRRDNELLQELIDEVATLADKAALGAERREQSMSDLLIKINALLDKLSSEKTQKISELDLLATGYDARIYRDALRSHTRDFDTERARALLRRVLEFGPLSGHQAAAKHWLGRIDYETGNFDEAYKQFTALLQEHPNAPREADTLLLLAEMTTLRGERREGIVWQERLLAQHPGSFAAKMVRRDLADTSLGQ